MADLLNYDLQGQIAIVTIDDGKANAVSPDYVSQVNAVLDRATDQAAAMVIHGRPGKFSAGFDLTVMGQGGDAMNDLVRSGAQLALRLLTCPIPVVIGCTGHAMAMGGLLLLSVDYRIGVQGAFKIGLNEVAIGMTLPWFGVELARNRLAPTYCHRAVESAEIFDPAGAVDAGFLDEVVAGEQLSDRTLEVAGRLASLDARAHRETKLRMRDDAARRLSEAIAAEFPS